MFEKDGKGCGKFGWEAIYLPDGVTIAIGCKFCKLAYAEFVCECGGTIQGQWLIMEDGPACPSCEMLGTTGLDGKSKCTVCGWQPIPPVIPSKDKSDAYSKSGAYSIWVNLIIALIFIALLVGGYFAFQ